MEAHSDCPCLSALGYVLNRSRSCSHCVINICTGTVTFPNICFRFALHHQSHSSPQREEAAKNPKMKEETSGKSKRCATKRKQRGPVINKYALGASVSLCCSGFVHNIFICCTVLLTV